MKLLFTLLLLCFTLCNSQVSPVQVVSQYAYAVWNSEFDVANFGIIDLTKAESNVTLSYPNAKHAGPQTASYNAKTNQILAVLQAGVQNTLYSIDIDQWEQVSNVVDFPTNFNISSIESDQTNGEYNLFVTYTLTDQPNKNSFIVGKISASSSDYKTQDTVPGQFLVSSYNLASQILYVTYSNVSGMYVNQYDSNGNLKNSTLFTLGGLPNGLVQSSNPYNMVYVPYDGTTILNIDLESDISRSAPDIFWVNATTSKFQDATYMGGKYMREGTSGVWALTTHPTKQLVYSISKTPLIQEYPSGISLDTIDVSNKRFKVTSNQFSHPIYRLWAY